MDEFHEFNELEDIEENRRMRSYRHPFSEEERDQIICGFNAKYRNEHEVPETNLNLDDNLREWEIRSREALHETLHKHWKIILTPNFNKRYKQATTYCLLMEGIDNGTIPQTPEAFREFAKENGNHRTTVPRWALGVKKPQLINQLEHLYYLDHQYRHENESERLSIIEGKKTPQVFFSTANDPQKMLDLKSFSACHFQILRRKVYDRHYIWVRDMNSLLNGFSNQYFYFNRIQDLSEVFKKAASQLELNTMVEAVYHIHQLSKQFTLQDRELISKDGPRLLGSSLQLLCDIAGITTKQLEGRIEKIAGANGRGGIENPRFPEGEHLEVLKARLIGIAVSDCHIPESGSLHFTEGSENRIDRVKNILDNFGSTYGSDSVRKRKGDYEFYIASPIARALNNWGIPSGDRTILNYGLPKGFSQWSKFTKCGYLQEMFAQECYVDKNGVIRWSRSHALHDGSKGQSMGFESKISENALEFLKDSQEMYKHQGIVNEQSISISRLESLKKSSDSHISRIADELINVVQNYHNRLIDDEVKLVRSLEIGISFRPLKISYFEKSDRVSVKWRARIKGYNSKIKSALILQPNFDKKEASLNEWLAKQNVNDVLEVKEKLKTEDYIVD